jgi:hypothetical protein
MTSRPSTRHAILVCCLLCLSFQYPAATAQTTPIPLLRNRSASERPKLMIVGVVHFDNPGHDVVNEHVDDVLSPQRQQEIEAISKAVARFNPTKIVVEWPIAQQEKLNIRYANYRQGKYTLTRNEIDQLGLRLAAMLKLPEVDAVDWNGMPPGVEADYNFEIYPDTPEARQRLAAMRDPNTSNSNSTQALSLNQRIYDLNRPEALADLNRRYFDYTLLGDANRNPGANWVGAWYARNLRIFANIVRLASSPSDRVLVIYGVGHAFPLTEFAEQSGAFSVESPEPLLRDTLKDESSNKKKSSSKLNPF